MAEKRRVSARLRDPAARRKETEDQSINHAPKPSGRTRGRHKHKPNDPEPSDEISTEKTPEKVETITLPIKVVEGQALPSLPSPQPKHLPDAEWQSVSESGVLAASIPRSRQRWLHEGMFETYWSKSTYKRKKDVSETNKIKEARPNMTKVGSCKMVVEPHIFDVTLFVIKDMTAPPQYTQNERPFVSYNSTPNQGVSYQTPSYQSPRIQSPLATNNPVYGPPNTAANSARQIPSITAHSPHVKPSATPLSNSSKPIAASQNQPLVASGGGSNARTPLPNTPSQPASVPQSATTTTHTTAQPTTHSSNVHNISSNKPSANPAISTTSRPSVGVTAVSTAGANTKLAATPTTKPKTNSSATPSVRQTSTQSTPQQTPKPAPAQDPVIQMLAHRAQNDPALKQVMKLVATGQASPSQLSYFQGHIDELTKIAKERQEEERRKKAALELQQKQNSVPRQQYAPMSAQGRPSIPHSAGPMQTPQGYSMPTPRLNTPTTHSAPRSVYQSSPASIQPRTPRPVFVPPPLHVLLEFSQNTTDRFLFPKNSILEYDSKRTSVLASFLVVKTESQLLSLETESRKIRKSDAKGKSKLETTPDTNPAKLPSNPKLQKEAGGSEEENKPPPGKAEKEFYQPVTVRFESPSDPTVLSVFGRVVAPVEQVKKYMLSVAEKAELVSAKHLALRLPREPKEIVMSGTSNAAGAVP